ncbi:VOC family protein [Hyphomicrobium sp.]|uniref:VOC family protein n=1 Tax=Hyphomicrobium sp. TaxID=82 RepID=UPI002FDEDEFA
MAANPGETKRSGADPYMHTVTPHLVCAGAAKAIDFYKDAFGAQEMMRLEGPDGRLWHGSIRIGESLVMLADEMPDYGSLGPKALKGTTVTLHLNVPDVDAFVAHATKAGAKIIMPVADAFWGDRYGQIEDPFGHRWSVATRVKTMTEDEIRAAMPTDAGCGPEAGG